MRIVVVALFAVLASALASGNAAEAAPSRGLRVSGNQLIDNEGQPVRLVGSFIGGRDQAACFALEVRDELGQIRTLAEGWR